MSTFAARIRGSGRVDDARGALARARAIAALVALLAALASPGNAAAEGTTRDLFLLAGAAWWMPARGPVADVYGAGPGIRLGLHWGGDARWSAALSADYFRASASPDRPIFVDDAETRLVWVPITLEARWRARPAPRAPFLLAGGSVWILDERFEYTLGGERASAEGDRTSLGGVVGLGYEIGDARLPLAFALRYAFSSLQEKILAGDGAVLDGGGSEGTGLWSVAVELRL